MSKRITWNGVGNKKFETGVHKPVLYVQTAGVYGEGVAWEGLVSVSESPSGAEANPIYANNIKYANIISNEEFAATIEAFTYPDEFNACDGLKEIAPGVYAAQQARTGFGLSYVTLIGNDVSSEIGYKIHIIYGAMAAPSEKAYQTVAETPEAITFSWELTTTPVEVPGAKPTALLTIDSTKVDAEKLAALEDMLYGNDTLGAKLPTPEEVIALIGPMV